MEDNAEHEWGKVLIPGEPTAEQMAQALLDADVFDSADATPVTGSTARAAFVAEFAADSPYLYEITVVRRARLMPAFHSTDPGLLVRVRTAVAVLVAAAPDEAITVTGLADKRGKWGSAHADGYWAMETDGTIRAEIATEFA